MEILEVHKEKYVSLTPKGELDANSSMSIDEIIGELIAAKKVHIHIDCSELSYISSAGLGVFISYLDEITEKGGEIVFSNMQENVLDVFELLGIYDLFKIVKNAEEVAEILNK